ncbi:MAG: hypothetical protein FJ240_04305 [Nitrospira sp.]|nr:hypothetical protein [Nitrospira sp.]
MRAIKILHTKEIKGDEIVETKIWQVLKSDDKPFGVKYSIVYVKDGKRVLGYDNAEGKGDHKHYRSNETAYKFSSIWNLLRDFKTELKRIRGGDWDED